MMAAFEQACAGGDAQPDVAGAGVKPAPVRLVPAAWLAVAAAILVVAGVGAWMWLGSSESPSGFDRIRLAAESEPWMLAVATRYANGQSSTERHWCSFADRQTYVLTDDETVVAYDYGRGQVKLAYSPKIKTLVVSELPRTGPFGQIGTVPRPLRAIAYHRHWGKSGFKPTHFTFPHRSENTIPDYRPASTHLDSPDMAVGPVQPAAARRVPRTSLFTSRPKTSGAGNLAPPWLLQDDYGPAGAERQARGVAICDP
ncbi:MAG TPA: hypothetical protein VLI39_12325 [Sedimentisphaerales bacterium]|nr:hypothetical protein [Sedimentisphaerales bacterium]